MEIKEDTKIQQEEKPVIPLKFAPWWKRLFSFLIDSIILGIIFSIVIGIVYQQDIKLISEAQNPYKLYFNFFQQNYFQLNIALTIIYVSYFGILWAGTAQTIGAKIMKIYIIDINSKKLNFLVSFLRAFLLLLSGNLLYIPLFFELNPVYKQRFHDFITNSVVIEKPDIKEE